MKILRNQYEYHQWMITSFLDAGTLECLLDLLPMEDIEQELIAQMPDAFPCVVYVGPGSFINEPEKPMYLSAEQIFQLAAELKAIKVS